MSHRETRPKADAPQTPVGQSEDPTDPALREAIAKRAFELYLQRGSESGYEVEDWLAAEAELTAAAAARKPTKR